MCASISNQKTTARYYTAIGGNYIDKGKTFWRTVFEWSGPQLFYREKGRFHTSNRQHSATVSLMVSISCATQLQLEL